MGELPSADFSSRYDLGPCRQWQGFFAILTAAFCPGLRCSPLTKFCRTGQEISKSCLQVSLPLWQTATANPIEEV